MAPKKGPTPKAVWVPMTRAWPVAWSTAQEEHAVFIEQTTGAKIDRPESHEMWKNNLYTVTVRRRSEGYVYHLSIRRNDRKSVHDWRHFQQIKDDIAGENVEAVELYPASWRLVDTANQYHLWCLSPNQTWPFGFQDGALADEPEPWPGAVQRPR
jgi:hypothetical protein